RAAVAEQGDRLHARRESQYLITKLERARGQSEGRSILDVQGGGVRCMTDLPHREIQLLVNMRRAIGELSDQIRVPAELRPMDVQRVEVATLQRSVVANRCAIAQPIRQT